MVELETIDFVNKGDTDFDTKKQPINANNLNQMQTNVSNALNSIQSKAEILNAGFHNSVYRGKDITSEWDAGTISTNIANGTFEDIYIGDYFTKSVTIDSSNYTLKFIIADLDTYYGYSNRAMITTHHASVVVTGLPDAQMNTSNTTTGGYYGSAMYTSTLPTYISAISDSLGSSHIVSHKILPSTSINSSGYNRFGSAGGCSNNCAWYSNTISLLTEMQVYGGTIWSSSGYDTGEAYKQLSLFRMVRPNTVVGNNWWWWLRDVASSSKFAVVHDSGSAISYNASVEDGGVVPLVLLK